MRRPGPERPSKHTRPMLRMTVDADGNDQVSLLGTYSATKPRPWAVRRARRIANRRARAARKANRS